MIMNIIEVVRQCKSGDYGAWNMIVNRYAKSIYNQALNFFGNREDAEDITQDVFIKILNNIGKFREEKNFNSWVMRISNNYCIDYWRKTKKNVKQIELDDDLIKQDETPEDRVMKNDDLEDLRKRMLILDPDLRMLIIMRDIQGYSYQQIAEALNLPQGTIKSRINRARLKLARTFLSKGDSNGL
jgi:RNA polymerase sigma-70 factor (ECF subfamily)